MIHKMKWIKLAVVMTLLFFTLNLSATETKLPGVLKVGTNAEFAPFSFMDQGEIKGFEIDLARAVCEKLHCKMELVDMPFEALVPEVRSGSVDFIAAGMTITKERERVVQFTQPYLEGEPLVACYFPEHHQVSNNKELLQSKIIVNDSYTADFYVTDELNLKPLRVQTPIEALMALKSKRGQVYILAKNTLAPLKNQNPSLTYYEIEDTQENCAIMVSKKSTALLVKINQAIEELKAEGVLDQLRQKWGV